MIQYRISDWLELNICFERGTRDRSHTFWTLVCEYSWFWRSHWPSGSMIQYRVSDWLELNICFERGNHDRSHTFWTLVCEYSWFWRSHWPSGSMIQYQVSDRLELNIIIWISLTLWILKLSRHLLYMVLDIISWCWGWYVWSSLESVL